MPRYTLFISHMEIRHFYKPIILLALVTLCSGACHKAVVEPDEPDNRGTKLADLKPTGATASFYGLLDWSVDGSELFYLVFIQYTTPTAGNYHLYALNVRTGTSRLVYDGPGGLNLITITNPATYFQSPDGQYLYLAARGRGQAGYSLYRINTRQTNQAVVIDSSYDQRYPASPYVPSTVLSADGSRLGFQYRPDSVRIHDLVNKTSVRFGAAQAIAFSPDASQVLLPQPNSGMYRNVSLTNVAETLVDPRVLPVNPAIATPSRDDIRWHSEGIRHVYTDLYRDGANSATASLHLLLWNVTQQKKTLLWTVPDQEAGVGSVVWARNGQRLVFTSSNSQQVYAGRTNYIMYTTDLTTLKTSRVATITLEDEEKSSGPNQLLISPDHTQLAYSIGSKLYAAPIQP